MKLSKINIKEFQKYMKDNELPSITQDILTTLVGLVNEYIGGLQAEGVMLTYISREGNERKKKNPISDSIIPTFSLIAKILKDNNLTLPKTTTENDNEQINFDNLLSKI